MSKRYDTRILPSYVQLRSIYLGSQIRDDKNFRAGRVAVFIDGDKDFSAEGSLNSQGFLSGMTKLYRRLGIRENDTIQFSLSTDGNVLIHPSAASPSVPPSKAPDQSGFVFGIKKFKHIHLEVFRPENLDNWEPEGEGDIYLAFGALQQFTDYKYCCGVSRELLVRLGADPTTFTKPDAILIDRLDDKYLMAEMKIRSSDFKLNHHPNDVDVLICWFDDQQDRSKLPPRVVALHEIARIAAQTSLVKDVPETSGNS